MLKILKNKFLMIGMFLVFSLVSEILMFFFVNGGLVPTYILLNVCTLVLLGSVIFFIPSNKASLIYLSCILGFQALLNIMNCMMYDNCGDVFSFLYLKLFGEAIRVFEVSFLNIGKLSLFVGVVVCFILLNVFLKKKNIIQNIESQDSYWVYLRKQLLTIVCVVVVFTTTYAVQVSYIYSKDDHDVFSDSYLYSSLNLKVDGLMSFGTWGFYAKEAQKVFFTSSKADEETINSVNEYLQKGEHKRTDYFGLAEDKNVIMIMMESYQWFAIDEHLTPNLYSLAKDGLAFSNHYSKNKTNVSEMIGITGSYPVTNTLSPKSTDYNFTNSIINYLDDEYVTTYVHGNTGDFYKRKYLMPQLGFENMYFFEDLYPNDKLFKWGSFALDSETMEKSLDYLVPNDGSKFYSFLTTLSTHGPYNDSEINGEKLTNYGYFAKIDEAIETGKWSNPLKGTKAEEGFRYYKAVSMDLDKAIGMLIEDLKNKGVYDDTVLVLYGDHNAYYDEISYLIYDAVGGEYYKPYVFKTPLIIYNEELTNSYKEMNDIADGESAHIEKFVSTYNIVPTLLDLLGHDFNSNLYLGTSVFNEENYDENNIFFSLQGGIFNKDIYTINGYDLAYTELEDYNSELETVRKASEVFLRKLKYIEYLYNYNMFEEVSFELEK